MTASPQQISRFLSDFKQAAEKELYVVNRDKNLGFLARYGFTVSERGDVILGLCVEDYLKGPDPDDRDPDGPRSVWVFGVRYENVWIYIKLKLIEEGGMKRAKCISFHDAEFGMRFPYRR